MTIVLVVGAAILLLLLNGKNKVNQESIDADDSQLLNTALESGDIASLLGDNDGPTIFVIPSSDSNLTKEQRIALIQSSADNYSAKVQTIVDTLAIDATEAMDIIALTIIRASQPGQEWTEKAFNLYMDLVSVWLQIYVSVNIGVSNAVAATMEAAGYAIDNANECVQTAFVADITETSEVTQEINTTITVSTTGRNGFFGIGGSTTTGKEILINNVTNRFDTRRIVYVPHCVNYEIDPVAVDAILASQTLAIQALYGQLSAALALAPDPFQLGRNGGSEPAPVQFPNQEIFFEEVQGGQELEPATL